MREAFVIDPLIGKRQQLLLATQLCRMVSRFIDPLRSSLLTSRGQVLKINNVIVTGSDENGF